MNIFVNCNNLRTFKAFVKTYTEENKRAHFIFGRQDIHYSLDNTDDELIQVLKENNINDYELLYASTVDKATPDDWKTELYRICSNMSIQMLAPWYIVKYLNKLPLMCVEEDITLGIDLNIFVNNGNKAMFSSLSMSDTGIGSEKAEAFMQISNTNCYYKDIYCRKVVGCPRYYENFDIEAFEKYCFDFYNNDLLYKVTKNRNTWHHGYIDEHFHSYSPIIFNPFGKLSAWILQGERSKISPSSVAKKLKTQILHFAGRRVDKTLRLKTVLEALNEV